MNELERYQKEATAALLALDMKWARQNSPGASCDEVILLAMHKARYEHTGLPADARHASGAWLRERGYKRRGGLPLLPEGQLPC